MVKQFEYEYVSYEELYQAYIDCRKRKRTTHNALAFEINENVELYKLWLDLNERKYVIGKSIVFCIDKPVKREVFAADFRDRIVHHLVINRINDILEDEFIDDSYSCRKGKGNGYGISKCYQYIQEATNDYTNECYIVKCDLKSFFMTIDKRLLYRKLTEFIKEKYKTDGDRQYEFMGWIIGLIVFNEPQKNCVMKQNWSHWDDLPKSKSLFFCDKDKGIPIGNLTSQIFANFYLSEFDHYVTDELNIRYYGRYVDDFYFIVKERKDVMKILKLMKMKLESLGARLHPHKLYIQPTSKGIKFVGAVIKYNRLYVANRTKGNFYWKIKAHDNWLKNIYEVGESPTVRDLEYFVSSVNSYIGFMVHYKSFNIRKKILTSDMMNNMWKYCYTNNNLSKITLYSKYKKNWKINNDIQNGE